MSGLDGRDGEDGRDGADDDFDLDLELEVSDLRRAPTVDTTRAGQPAGGRAREAADARGTEPEVVGVAGAAETVERTAWRRAAPMFTARRVRRYVVTGLMVLVCVGLLLSLPGTQQALRQALLRPTPSPTMPLTSGENLVAFEHTAPWGHLTLDGTPEAPQFGQFGQMMPLPRGRHTLTYAAAPWPVLRCQLSVPAQRDDTCPVDAGFQFENESLARVIDLGATPDRLPAVQQKALTSAVASALQANVETTAVPQGDHYRTADNQIAVATQPLRASLVLTLNTNATGAGTNSVIPGPGPCVSLCSEPGDFGSVGEGSAWWVVWAHVVAHWRFTAADGTRIDPGSSSDLDAAHQVGATWSESPSGSPSGGSWSVTARPYASTAGDQGDLCDPVFQRAFSTGNPLPSVSGVNETFYTGPSEVEGCVIVMSPGSNGGEPFAPNATPAAVTPTPTPLPAGTAIFIIRFGMVLAGNDAAHTAQPQLPVASAHERALAQQWMTQS